MTWDLDLDGTIPPIRVTPDQEAAVRAILPPDLIPMVFPDEDTGTGHLRADHRRRAVQRRAKGLGRRADT